MRKLLTILFATTILNGFYADVQANDFVKSKNSTQNHRTEKSEHISFKLAKINGKISFLTKSRLLFKLIGKPAHLTNPDLNDYCGSFYDKPFKLMKVKGITAEIYGDTAVVQSINFKKSPNLSLTTALITLNFNTTLTDLQRVFPKSVKAKTVMKDVDFGEVTAVDIAIGTGIDDHWLLLFQNGKLVRIDYYSPC